ncbi:MAG: hypothetical protein AAB932_01770, partial [Patescibacteria group bacterium]
MGLSGGGVTEYLRDPEGRILEMKYPGNQMHIQYEYDRSGKTKTVKRLGAREETLYTINPDTAYDELGHLLTAMYGNGVQESYEYYSASRRLRKTRDVVPAQGAAGTTGAAAEKILRDLEYRYNAVGNFTNILDRLESGMNRASLENIHYDDLHRVTAYRHYQGEAIATAERFAYDATGNMTLNTESFGAEAYVYNVSGHTHGVGQIGAEQFAYDANGNMTTGRGKTMEYDGLNRLSKVTLTNNRVIDYGYGSQGERLFKKTSGTGGESATYYFGNTLEVRDNQLIHNIYAGDRLIATIGEGQWPVIASAAKQSKVMPGWYIGKLEMDQVSKVFLILLG